MRKHFEISLETDERFSLGTKDVPSSILANKLELNLESIEGIKHEMLLPKIEIPKFLSPEPKSKLDMIKANPENIDSELSNPDEDAETMIKSTGAFSNSTFDKESRL